MKAFGQSHIIRSLLIACLAAVCLTSFLNCSGGFRVAESLDQTSKGSFISGKQDCSIGLIKDSKRIYRKNRQMVGNAIADIFGEKTLAAVSSPLNSISPDAGYVKGYESFINTVTEAQVQSYHALADALAADFVSDDARLVQRLGAECSSTADYLASPQCFESLKKKIIEPLFSQALSDSDMQAIKAVYSGVVGTSAEKLEETIYFVTQDPRFYYSDMKDPEKFVILRELARLIWYSVPDEKILAYAQKDALTAADISTLIEVMLKDPKADRLLTAFFVQWLGIDQLKPFSYSENFLGGANVTGLRDAMIEEAKDFVRYTIIEKKGTLKDLFSSQYARTAHADLASIYGVTPSANWQDIGENRRGILSRGAFLATGNTETKPILRGVKLTRQILCNPIHSPPADIVNMRFNSGIDPTNLSTRQLNDARVKNTTCMGCHSTINPYGHGLGVFDGMGRLMMTDRQFDANGVFAKAYPLEPSLSLPIDGKTKGVTIGKAFLSEIAESQQVAQCFDMQLYRFLVGEAEPETQSCGWTEMSYKTHGAVPVVDVISDVLKKELGGK